MLPLVVFLFGIAHRRCRWQMQAARNFRSRAIGGPSRSKPGNGLCGKAVCKNRFSFRERKEKWFL